MSIRDGMVQKVLGNPGKYSIEELKSAMENGSLPAYVVVPLIQDKMQQQKQMQASMLLRQPAPKDTPPIAAQIMQEAQAVRGLDTLPTNLPQQYAHGGIVAFDEGGEVERFQTGGRSKYEEFIRRRAAELGVDPDLAMRMFATESNFNPQAVSPKGAVGIGQLMPGTAKDLGLSPEELTDPIKNIDASLRYLDQQQKRFGDPQKAAAAYNMGPTALARLLEKTGGVLDRGGLNPETAKYLTSLFPVGSAVAGEPAPKGIAQLGQDPLRTIPRMQPDTTQQGTSEYAGPEFGNVETPTGMVGELGIPGFAGYPEAPTPPKRPTNQQEAAILAQLQAQGVKIDRGMIEDIRAGRYSMPTPAPTMRPSLVGPEPETAGMAVAMPGAPKETQVAAATQQLGGLAPAPVDIMSLVQDAPAQIRSAMRDIIDQEEARLKKESDPEFAAIEKKQAERRTRFEESKKADATNALLAFLSKTASTSGHWARAVGAGGDALVDHLIKSQAAQQAAESKLDDAEDALRLRKIAEAKNDRKAAREYGEKYSSLLMQGTKLQVEGAYHYNANQIATFDADTRRETLIAGKKRLEVALAQAQTGNVKAKTALLTASTKAIQQWDTSTEKRSAETSIAEKYGKDWMKLPLKNDKRIAAQAELDQEKARWVSNNMALHAAMGTFGGDDIAANVRSYEDLMGS